jgi:adenosylmethionine-8-amino-7-oxononanoate aminotransferase
VGNLNVMSPPLVLTRENVDFIVETLRESILATQEELQIR